MALKQDRATYNHGIIVNIYIVYEIVKVVTLAVIQHCLFGTVSLTKHADIDQYKYPGCGIGFDRKGEFSSGNGFGRNCIIFGVDMSSSVHVDNKRKIF